MALDKPAIPQSFREVMEAFPSLSAFARACGAPGDRGRVWYRRGAPPRAMKEAVVEACRFHGLFMTPELFDQLWAGRAPRPDYDKWRQNSGPKAPT